MQITACECRAQYYQREHRTRWMRLVPGRRLYVCAACGARMFIPQRLVERKLAATPALEAGAMPALKRS